MDSGDLFHNPENSLELEEVLFLWDQRLRRLIGYDAASVFLLENGELTPAYVSGQGFARSCDGRLLARALRERQPVLHRGSPDSTSGGSDLIFPIGQGREINAILVLHRDTGNAFASHDLDTFRSVAPALAASITNALKHRRAEQLAEADPFTGLANIRSLFKRLDAELARARRAQTTLAVLQCSIEGLDLTGSLCSLSGTRSAFEKLAVELREKCREYDFAARSGDAIVLVLPGLQPEFFPAKRELIERTVEEVGVNTGLPLSATIGVAFFPSDGTDAEDLLAAAACGVKLARQSGIGRPPWPAAAG